MVFYKHTKDKLWEKERCEMLNDEICKMRDKLNNSIASGEDYSVIYKISVELDELIAEYYRRKKERSKFRISVCY